MAWNIADLFPPWGDSGSRPGDNFNYQGDDQVNEKHFDYLWHSLNELENEVRSALTDIDSDKDGVVDEADSANLYKGNDIDGDGDGRVDAADDAFGYKGNDIDTDGDGVVNEADDASLYKGNDIDSDGDGTVDAADDAAAYDGLAPSDGTSGQVLQTDGSVLSWITLDLWTVSGSLVQPPSGTSGIDVDTIENKHYKEDTVTASPGTSYDVDVTASNVFLLTLTDNTSFTFSNNDTAMSNSFTLRLQQDATGGRTPSWPSNVEWPSGTEPSWSTASSAVDVVSFVYDSERDVWYGLPGGIGFA
jgi:hypothetical protein